ncbi:hypothetical protein [Salidesulfovibrio onnuriiensis]|uniref:hypothetical protein n=1 Tax=Salidesulfovibrio onnuriiensis TaxID=2583823 RepID=UPI0011CA1B8D|nr:hypothetical protein [Salidesulfovibrio onnuriiensis]
MGKLLKGLLFGTAAAAIDVAPMLAMGLGWHECASAFLHWVGLGVIIAYLRMPLPGWLAGAVAGLLTGVPVVLLVLKTDPTSVMPVSIASVVLGAGLGFMTRKFITEKESS